MFDEMDADSVGPAATGLYKMSKLQKFELGRATLDPLLTNALKKLFSSQPGMPHGWRWLLAKLLGIYPRMLLRHVFFGKKAYISMNMTKEFLLIIEHKLADEYTDDKFWFVLGDQETDKFEQLLTWLEPKNFFAKVDGEE